MKLKDVCRLYGDGLHLGRVFDVNNEYGTFEESDYVVDALLESMSKLVDDDVELTPELINKLATESCKLIDKDIEELKEIQKEQLDELIKALQEEEFETTVDGNKLIIKKEQYDMIGNEYDIGGVFEVAITISDPVTMEEEFADTDFDLYERAARQYLTEGNETRLQVLIEDNQMIYDMWQQAYNIFYTWMYNQI